MEYFFYSIICICLLMMAIASVYRTIEYEALVDDVETLKEAVKMFDNIRRIQSQYIDDINEELRQQILRSNKLQAEQERFIQFCNMPRHRG